MEPLLLLVLLFGAVLAMVALKPGGAPPKWPPSAGGGVDCGKARQLYTKSTDKLFNASRRVTNHVPDSVYEVFPDETSEIVDLFAYINTINGRIWAKHSFGVLFHPGVYTFNNVELAIPSNVGVLGLGHAPQDTLLKNCIVTITGHAVEPVTNIFWRSLENLSVESHSETNSHSVMWFTSQACPLRRVVTNGDVGLDHGKKQWSSGGFMADCCVGGRLRAYTQQQFCFRSVHANGRDVAPGNYLVYVDSPSIATSDCTHVDASSADVLGKDGVLPTKPYLSVEGINVFSGTQLHTIPWSDIVVVTTDTKVSDINAATAILVTSGRYNLSGPIKLTRPGTVLLGVGWPLLRAGSSTEPIVQVAAAGVTVAGLLVEAGTGNPDTLVQVSGDGAQLFDVFVRMLTLTSGTSRAKTMMSISASNVYLENSWIWRADHQQIQYEGIGVNWAKEDNPIGLEVTGENVVALGLAVEHQSSVLVRWTGRGGRCFFFQAEFPYEFQQDGSPAYLTTDPGHVLRGAGIYYVVNRGDFHNLCAVDAPPTATIQAIGKNWDGMGGITHTRCYKGVPVDNTPVHPNFNGACAIGPGCAACS